MQTQNSLDIELIEVGRIVFEEQQRLSTLSEWKNFILARDNLFKAASDGPLPFDPRFNAVHWAFDVSKLCCETAYSLIWMNAYANFYMIHVQAGTYPSHTNFHVSYFADNCMTRIDACVDKLALLVWAFYCPFNPKKKVLDHVQIMERLRSPVQFVLTLKGTSNFIKYLEKLTGPHFEYIKRYRNYKIHRREPRIELYGVESHHDWPYMLPLTDEREIDQWKANLVKQYPDIQMRNIIEKSCYIKGVLFDHQPLKDRLWDYNKLRPQIEKCLLSLLETADGCFRILMRRPPLRNKK